MQCTYVFSCRDETYVRNWALAFSMNNFLSLVSPVSAQSSLKDEQTLTAISSSSHYLHL